MEGLFYFTGLVGGLFFSGFIAMCFANSSLKRKYNHLQSSTQKIIDENESLVRENKSFKDDNDRRCARYTSRGWYKRKDENDANKYTWSVYFDLRKVSTSDDRKNSKFEIVSITSGNTKDVEDCSEGTQHFNFYRDWFLKDKGDGWLRNSEVEWVIDLPNDVLRDKKLKDLGIE